MTLFVDTSIWYASADSGDLDNKRAKSILMVDEPLLTTDHVLVETWLLLHRRLGEPAAKLFWAGIRGGVAHIESVSEVDLEVAWSIGEAYLDQDFSIVDRTSFAVMQRLGLERVASLDADFAVYRPDRRKDRVFVIVS